MSHQHQSISVLEVGAKCLCQFCQKEFTEKSSLTRHLKKNVCRKPKISHVEKDIDISKRDAEISKRETEITKKELEITKKELEVAKMIIAASGRNENLDLYTGFLNPCQASQVSCGNPQVVNNNQNLNVLCLGSKDNLLDILANKEGLPKALEYLKDCALAKLAGDCRILERVYQLETDQPVIMYLNQSKTKYVYYDDRRRRTVETNAKVMAKKLADILQRSYLKGMTCFKTDLADNERDDDRPVSVGHGQDKMPDLAPYDMQNWNEHVHLLSDEKYQKKVLTSMKIPIETGRD
jgi:hypothetical protein